jgi:hypothetical protein
MALKLPVALSSTHGFFVSWTLFRESADQAEQCLVFRTSRAARQERAHIYSRRLAA